MRASNSVRGTRFWKKSNKSAPKCEITPVQRQVNTVQQRAICVQAARGVWKPVEAGARDDRVFQMQGIADVFAHFGSCGRRQRDDRDLDDGKGNLQGLPFFIIDREFKRRNFMNTNCLNSEAKEI